MKRILTAAIAATLTLPAVADTTEKWWKPKCKTPKYAGLYNISTRGFVGERTEALVGGFIIKANHKREKLCVVIRGRGQSVRLPDKSSLLADPTLRLVRLQDKKVLATNDDWRDSRYSDIIRDTFPEHMASTDAGIFICLKPGNYTATIRGKGHETGIAIVEVVDIEFDDKLAGYCRDDDDDSSED